MRTPVEAFRSLGARTDTLSKLKLPQRRSVRATSNLTLGPPTCCSAGPRSSFDLPENTASGFAFTTERGGPFTADAINRLIKRIGERAGMPFPVHAHMLRHGCGYALANAGHDTRAIQDWLGHRSIQHTVRFTELSPTRFKDFWRD